MMMMMKYLYSVHLYLTSSITVHVMSMYFPNLRVCNQNGWQIKMHNDTLKHEIKERSFLAQFSI